MLKEFIDSFTALPDPRVHVNKIRHQLIDIVTITVCAVLAGGEDWSDVVEFGQAKKKLFSQFLKLPNGIPSHDTFSRVFSLIDPEVFGQCFVSWVKVLEPRPTGFVALDGKTSRRSHDGEAAGPLHLVSAYCSENGLVLGQLVTEEKSNEITAIPKLLEVLDLAGTVVTIDAMGAQKAIVAKIVDRDADYVVALKSNQPKLFGSVEALFGKVDLDTGADGTFDASIWTEDAHGRNRTIGVYATAEIPALEGWKGLSSVAMVITESVDDNGRLRTDKRFYISSLAPDADQISRAVRAHWGIENRLHWVLDVTFNEDQSRLRRDNGAGNLAVMRHAALNMLRLDPSKGSIKAKRKRAGWDDNYLQQLLFG